MIAFVKNYTTVIQDTLLKITISGETSTVFVLNVIAFNLILSLAGNFPVTTCLIVSTIGQEVVMDTVIPGNLHAYIFFGFFNGLLLYFCAQPVRILHLTIAVYAPRLTGEAVRTYS